MEAVVGANILVKGGESRPVSSIKPEFWALYFGAHWAPPSRKFTGDLEKFYTAINAKKKVVEVIFCSMDGNEEHFNRNFGLMNWCALPYTEEARLAALKV